MRFSICDHVFQHVVFVFCDILVIGLEHIEVNFEQLEKTHNNKSDSNNYVEVHTQTYQDDCIEKTWQTSYCLTDVAALLQWMDCDVKQMFGFLVEFVGL